MRPFDGEECRCGGRGCLETLAGQEAIARRVGIQGTRSETSSPATLVAERVQEGDAAVVAALDEVAEILGICIAAVVSIVNPRRVVLAGTLGTLSQWLLPGVRAAAAQRATVSLRRSSRSSDRNSATKQLSEGAPRSSYTTC